MSMVGGEEAARIYTTVGTDLKPLAAGLEEADTMTRRSAKRLQARQLAAARSVGHSTTKFITAPVIAAAAAGR